MKIIDSRTTEEVQRQFWREDAQRWVDHVLIRNIEIGKTLKWRHRTVIKTVAYGDWEEGK